MSYADLLKASDEMYKTEGERDRARRLAAHLEEVVAMQRVLISAMAEWDPDERPQPAFQTWARALLSEVP